MLSGGSAYSSSTKTPYLRLLPEFFQGLIDIRFEQVKLTKREMSRVDFDYVPSERSSFEVHTPWKIKEVQGAAFENIPHICIV